MHAYTNAAIENCAFMQDFLSTSGVRRDARYIVRETAGYSGVDITTLTDDESCKAWADGVSADSLQAGLHGFCQFMAHELAKIPSCEAQRQRNRSIALTFARTFPSVKAVTIRHDSGRKDAYPIKDGAEDTTVAASVHGTHVQVTWAYRAAKETVLSPEQPATQGNIAIDTPAVGDDVPGPNDTRYTHAAVSAALADLQAQLAEALNALATVVEEGRTALEAATAPLRNLNRKVA